MIDIWVSDISRAAPATSNQLRIWDLQSLPVDTTGGASKRLFTVASGSLTGRRHRHIPADGLKTNHLGSAGTVIFSTTKKKKKEEATPGYVADAYRQLIESLGSFPCTTGAHFAWVALGQQQDLTFSYN